MPRHTPYDPGYPFQISSHYGRRLIGGTDKFHHGVDYAAPDGTSIPAATEGTVVFSGHNPSYGNAVILEHTDEWGKRFFTLYAHLKEKTNIKHGISVKAGEGVGAVDHSGSSHGDHLHFEVFYPDGFDNHGPYFLVGKQIKYLNITGKDGHLGIPGDVGRRNPETYQNYGGDVFAKGHPKYRQYRHEQTGSIAAEHSRTRNEPPPANRHTSGGTSGHETLERHGTEVIRKEADGSTRGSFHSE